MFITVTDQSQLQELSDLYNVPLESDVESWFQHFYLRTGIEIYDDRPGSQFTGVNAQDDPAFWEESGTFETDECIWN